MSRATDARAAAARRRVRLVGLEMLLGEEAAAVAQAAVEWQAGVTVTTNAAVTIVEAPGRLEINPGRVADLLGRDWDATDLQVITSSYFGYIGRWDDEAVVLEWVGAGG